MELRDKLRQALKKQFGIETDKELLEMLAAMPGIDLGIFVNSVGEEEKIA